MVNTFLTFVFDVLVEFVASDYFVIFLLIFGFFIFSCFIRILRGVFSLYV